ANKHVPARDPESGSPFVKKRHNEDVRPALTGEVVGFHSHAPHRVAPVVRGRPAQHAAGLKSPIAQIPVVIVWDLVVSDEDIRLAVIVEVDNDHAKCLAIGFNPRPAAHVRKGAVAVIAKKYAAAAGKLPRSA